MRTFRLFDSLALVPSRAGIAGAQAPVTAADIARLETTASEIGACRRASEDATRRLPRTWSGRLSSSPTK